MSITIWNVGDVFTVRIYKSIASRPDLKWANTYELAVSGSGAGNGTIEAEQATRTIAEFESKLHLTDVRFDRGVFSTFNEDGQPYDPDTFASYSLADVDGERIPSGEVSSQPLQLCLLVRKNVSFGRAGRFLYRRVLTEAEINSAAGDPALASGVADTLNGIMSAALPSSGEELIGSLAAVGLSLCMAARNTAGTLRVRGVENLQAVGVTIKKYNNRYFDRVVTP